MSHGIARRSIHESTAKLQNLTRKRSYQLNLEIPHFTCYKAIMAHACRSASGPLSPLQRSGSQRDCLRFHRLRLLPAL